VEGPDAGHVGQHLDRAERARVLVEILAGRWGEVHWGGGEVVLGGP
jgi:hypothetical protein